MPQFSNRQQLSVIRPVLAEAEALLGAEWLAKHVCCEERKRLFIAVRGLVLGTTS